MRRELWSIGCTFGYAVRVLNSIFCSEEIAKGEDREQELNNEESWLVVEQVNALCSQMMIEDAYDILGMVSVIPNNRLCERTDCKFHHPEHFQKHDFTIFQDKCDECIFNEKSKINKDSQMEHFESV